METRGTAREYYHGSPTGGLSRLEPHSFCQHTPCVYLTANAVVAALYAVKPVEQPHSFYPYGFQGKVPVYTEYYPHALEDLYGGKTGYVYHCYCDAEISLETDTANPCAMVSRKPVEVCGYMELLDVLEALLEYERCGKLMVRRYDTLNWRQLEYIRLTVAEEIQKYRLKETPSDKYSAFLRQRFPEVWNQA